MDFLQRSEAVTVGRNDMLYVIINPSTAPEDRKTKVQTLRAAMGIVVKRKSADESVTSSTTMQDDDELWFAAEANDIWVIDYTIFYDGNTSGDIKLVVNGPSGATCSMGSHGLISSATTSSGTLETVALAPYTSPSTSGLVHAASTTRSTIMLRATVVMPASAGNITLQWAQNGSNATATRIFANSFLTAYRI